MLVKIEVGMKFRSTKFDREHINDKFVVVSDWEVMFVSGKTVPLAQINLKNYMPMVKGKWINEKNQYDINGEICNYD